MSTNFEHLAAVVLTESGRRNRTLPVRLLDLGCGNGRLLEHLIVTWREMEPTRVLECYGLDVGDHGVQAAGFLKDAAARLARVSPGEEWESRLQLISTKDQWPWHDDFFDVIISNQVMEHIEDHSFAFGEIKRTLKEGGYSAHVFPMEHCIWEGHIRLLGYHWLRDHDLRVAYVKLMLALGLKARTTNLSHRDAPADHFASCESDVMRDFTNYITVAEAHRLAHRAKLRLTFRYTRDYYFQFLRKALRRPPQHMYATKRSAVLDRIALTVCRHLASVTMILEKRAGEAQSLQG